MAIDYSKPIDFDEIEDLSIIDESKLQSRDKIKYKKAVKARAVALESAKKSSERAEVVKQVTSNLPASDYIPSQEEDTTVATESNADKKAKLKTKTIEETNVESVNISISENSSVSTKSKKVKSGINRAAQKESAKNAESVKENEKKPAEEKKSVAGNKSSKSTSGEENRAEAPDAEENTTETGSRNEAQSRPKYETNKRYIGKKYDELILSDKNSKVLQIKYDLDTADELEDQARRKRKEITQSIIVKVGLQIVLEMTDKEYAELKLVAARDGKSIGTVVHEAVSAYLKEDKTK